MTALLIGALAVSLLLIGLFARIGGAVIGVGQVAVQSRVKTIIHPSGGVLSGLYVRDGDRVSSGQILMRFDTSVAAIDASRSGMGLNELLARRARLEAERDNRLAISFAPELTGSADEGVTALIERERRQFALNLNSRNSTLALLRERVAQGEAQVRNLEAQVTANRRQSALIEPELAGLRNLYERKLVTVGRLNQLERAAVEIEGNRAALQASIAQVRAQIAETREQMLGVEVNVRAGAAAELAQVNAQTNEQMVRRASAVSTFERSAVRAPQAGVIDKLAYTTIGSAIPPGQPILQIVPDAGELVIEGRVNPRDIDQIRIGQSARVSFPSLNRQTTPDVTGKVVFVSAQPGQDALTGRPYFRVHVSFDRRRLAHAIAAPLVDGMPAEIFFETSRRSVWSYLFKPLFDQLAHAMRED
ncbi:HlyD family type I secretion periplasmic adaptor subunit [Novosphingobium sp. CF614]|uniref:HlyD family type I secretion periplasmic adaptor subunit n=1 Tax=Novosphingobium sp. CF614 TaxID=1884364 RepID=UPI0015A67E5C|nr:HlyD family type I secretion periplasmic adaptor subunit [Novosphingobium sp. CF614]